MTEKLIEQLHGDELFLKNRTQDPHTPLNGYDCEYMLDIVEHINAAIEALERAIVPPCKVGDTIYEIISPKDKEPYLISAVVCAVHIANGSRNSCNHKRESYILAECPNTKYVNKRLLRKFGKTVFTSREAAEKALAERSGNIE